MVLLRNNHRFSGGLCSEIATMQQTMFVMVCCILVFMLMSGLLTPISSMPEWAQVITWLNPPRYFIEMMRGVEVYG